MNFATGKNHVNLPQVTDNMCANCHTPKGETEFDASIKGAHLVATRSTQLPGVVFDITRVDNAKPGEKPASLSPSRTIRATAVDISKMARLSLVLAGPTTDYNGYVTEDARKRRFQRRTVRLHVHRRAAGQCRRHLCSRHRRLQHRDHQPRHG